MCKKLDTLTVYIIISWQVFTQCCTMYVIQTGNVVPKAARISEILHSILIMCGVMKSVRAKSVKGDLSMLWNGIKWWWFSHVFFCQQVFSPKWWLRNIATVEIAYPLFCETQWHRPPFFTELANTMKYGGGFTEWSHCVSQNMCSMIYEHVQHYIFTPLGTTIFVFNLFYCE